MSPAMGDIATILPSEGSLWTIQFGKSILGRASAPQEIPWGTERQEMFEEIQETDVTIMPAAKEREMGHYCTEPGFCLSEFGFYSR